MKPLLVMAGGTGGHVYPALAVAESLRGRGVSVVWLGTRAGLEARVVPAAGFPIDWVSMQGLRGHGPARWAVMPFVLLRSLFEALGVMRRRRPGALLGMGGFVTGPGGVVGWLLRRPLLIHEQNAVAGTANRLLAKFARHIMVGFPATRGLSDGAEWVGNPVRPAIAALPDPRTRLATHAGALRVLVVGGSQGARVLNEVLPDAVRAMSCTPRPEVWHQCGRDRRAEVQPRYADLDATVRIDEFIDDMAAAYAWSDLVVCRAGAMTVAEVAAAGAAAILVPYPHATDDHQTANARYLADSGGALLLAEADVTPEALAAVLDRCAADRAQIAAMAATARSLARPDATDRVVRRCLEALGA